MGAGSSVGRIGGLVVALGVGAAVFTGYGVAWAAPAESGSGSSSTTSSSTTDSSTNDTKTGTTVGTKADSKTDTGGGDVDEPKTSVSASTTTSHTDTGPDLDSEADDPSDSPEPTTTLDDEAPSTQTEQPKTLTGTSKHAVQTVDTAEAAPVSEPVVRAQTSAPEPVEEPAPVIEAEPTPSAEAPAAPAPEITPTAQPVTVQADPAPTPQPAPEPDAVNPIATAVSGIVNALASPFAGDAPSTPTDSPAMWTVLAAARRETSGAVPSLAQAADPVTTSQTTDAVPTDVRAIPQTAPLEFLQHIPVLGPMFVTPIVAAIQQIPLIGDVLHPLIGYPVRWDQPAGTPTARDVKVVSFDGTWIYVHFFPAAGLAAGEQAPTILNGPGLSLPGETNPNAQENPFLPHDVIGMAPLLQDGYNVVTWDPRGEWQSGGTLEIDSPDYEARDMQSIISWIAQQPEAELDSPNDPRLGMVGASYGGGIQMVTAAIDHRVDAIVPTIAWHDLTTSLYKEQAFKSSWGTLLSAALTFTLARSDPRILPAAIRGDLTGTITPDDLALLASRGPGDLVNDITAPTLLFQGTVDTLFSLAEADANAKALIANGVDTKVVWFCGGHGACVSSYNDGKLIKQRTLQWLDRYVKGDVSVSTGPQFEWVDQHGQQFSSDTYPVPHGTPIVGSSGAPGTLPLVPIIGGSGPQWRAFGLGPIRALLGLPTAGEAYNAYSLTLPAATTTTYVVGAPELTMTYSGVGLSRHVYAQLVDPSTGLVLGNQVTPVPVTLDGKTHTVTLPMEMVAHTLAPGQTLLLQVVASAVPYETAWSLGALEVSSLSVSVPTADASAITTPVSTAQTVAA